MTDEKNQSTHDTWHRQIEDCFYGRLRGEELNGLYDHLRECSDCSRVFARFSAAERALVGATPDSALTSLERSRVASRLFEKDAPKSRTRSPFLLGAFFATAAALGVVFVASPRRPGPARDEQMRARGVDGQLSHRVSLRVLRVRDVAGQPAVSSIGDGDTVEANDELRFVYTNLADFEEGTLVLVGPNGRKVLTSGYTLSKGAEDAAFGSSLVVPPEWPPGEITLTAVFTRSGAPKLNLEALPGPRDTATSAVRVVRTRLVAGDLPKLDEGRE